MLSAPELREFLEDQGEDGATLAHAQHLIQTYELNETGAGLTDGAGVNALSWHLGSAITDCGCHLGQVTSLLRDSAATSLEWDSNIPSSQGLVED